MLTLNTLNRTIYVKIWTSSSGERYLRYSYVVVGDVIPEKVALEALPLVSSSLETSRRPSYHSLVRRCISTLAARTSYVEREGV